MASKQDLLDGFADLGINPPGGASVEDLERTLDETRRNMGQVRVEEFLRENEGKLGLPKGVTLDHVLSPGGVVIQAEQGIGGGDGQNP